MTGSSGDPYAAAVVMDPRLRGGDCYLVMAGLVPAIHALFSISKKDVDARDKRGHDG